MSDLYGEQLIKTKSSAGQKILCVFLTLGTILLLALGIFFMPVILVAGLALGWAAWMAFQRLRVEYEYLYVNGELDIDTIYGRVKRKKTASFDLNDLQAAAWEKSHSLDSYRSNPGIQKMDFTSKRQDSARFILVFQKEGKNLWVAIEPDEVMINDMKLKAPRKVFLD